jgi:hypothetical protein
MKIIESFLDRVQTEKLDVSDIIRKTNKVFNRVYTRVSEDCFSTERRNQYYTEIQPDLDCENKGKKAAYEILLTRLDKWINHCRDIRCKQSVKYAKHKIQYYLTSLQNKI